MKKNLVRNRVICFLVSVCLLAGYGVDLSYVKAADNASSENICVSIRGDYQRTDAKKVYELVNQFRKKENLWYWNEDDTKKIEVSGLKPLTYDYDLQKAAEQRAAEIAISYSHTRPNGEDPFGAVSECSENFYEALGENIAAGQESAEEVFEDWREENEDYDGQGHRRNMLDTDFNAIGVASFYCNGTTYWVQEFGYTDTPNQSSTDKELSDDSKNTMVNVDTSEATFSNIRTKPAVIGLAPTDEEKVPYVTANLKMSNTFGKSKSVYIENVTWTSEDESIAKVEQHELIENYIYVKGQGKLGETYLTATVAGTALQVKVYVTEDGEVTPEQSGSIPINEEYFPDEAFRAYIKDYIDLDEDGYLDQDTIEGAKDMYLSDSYGTISDLTGIEWFTQIGALKISDSDIEKLDCSKLTQLSNLRVENCPKLQKLDIASNANLGSLKLQKLPELKEIQSSDQVKVSHIEMESVPKIPNVDFLVTKELCAFRCKDMELKSVNLSGCENLIDLSVNDCGIETLVLSGCTSLPEVECYDNALTSLDVSGMTNLESLDCSYNQLTKLSLTKLPKLRKLFCQGNQIKSLDVRECKSLENLICSANGITKLLVENENLLYLQCDYNPLTTLDVSGCKNLRGLTCSNCGLDALDVTNNTKITKLTCANQEEEGKNNITEIKGIEKLLDLEMLCTYWNPLKSLDLSNAKKLEVLDISACENVTALNLKNCPELLKVSANGSGIKTLDVANNRKLMDLRLDETKIKTLDVSKNTDLRILMVSDCQLTNLDVSSCKKLARLECDNNKLTSLNINGCTNLQILCCNQNSLFGLDTSTNDKIGHISYTACLYENKNGDILQQFYQSSLYEFSFWEAYGEDYTDYFIEYSYWDISGDDDVSGYMMEMLENDEKDLAFQQRESIAAEEVNALSEEASISEEINPMAEDDSEEYADLYILQSIEVPAEAIKGETIDLSKFLDVSKFDSSKVGKMFGISLKGTKFKVIGSVRRMYFDYYAPVFTTEQGIKIPFRLLFYLSEEASAKMADDVNWPYAEEYSGTYDGKAHTIKVKDVYPGSKIMYRTSTKGSWSTKKPTRTKVGKTRVYCKITHEDWSDRDDYADITIRPKGTSLTKVSAGKRSFTAKWKKQATEASGYQIRYSTKSSMSGSKTKTISGTKSTSRKITGLTSKKSYYVQIRTYKKVDGKTYYSSWSKTKKVKVK